MFAVLHLLCVAAVRFLVCLRVLKGSKIILAVVLTVAGALVDGIGSNFGFGTLKVMSIFFRIIQPIIATRIPTVLLLCLSLLLAAAAVQKNLFAFFHALLLLHLLTPGQYLLLSIICVTSPIEFGRRRILFADVAVSDSIVFFNFAALFL